jgi:hypothetical protein
MGHLHGVARKTDRAMSMVAALPGATARPWKRATLWLICLAPFFYLTYGMANWFASIRPHVGSIVFDWERQIPFWAWTIIPYWSINAFYGASLFVCNTARELDNHGRRLLTAQVVAVTCFVLFPLRFTFSKPDTGGGLPGFLFDTLAGFDKPYNQAPSLHIALLVILWLLYARHVPRWARLPLHLWYILIGASVLTTYQHHFIDIPTGALLGLFCLWLWPDQAEAPIGLASVTADPARRKLALLYAAGGALFALAAIGFGGTGLWLFYPAVSLWLVAANYALFGPQGFQKAADGSMSLATRLLLAPYIAAAWFNSRIWTRHEPKSVPISAAVFLGRIPSRLDRSRETCTSQSCTSQSCTSIVDLAAELPSARVSADVHAFPALDLVVPPVETLRGAAEAVEQASRHGTVLVCCALGYSRSAAVVATWLVRHGRAGSVEEAIALIARARPKIVLGPAARSAIATAAGVR